MLWHDPHGEIRPTHPSVTVYNGVAELRRAPTLTPLSVVRGDVNVDELAHAAVMYPGAVTLVLDELDRACNGKRWISDWTRRIVHEGRHTKTNLWGSFRRNSNVNEDLLSQAMFAFVFRHQGETDRQLLMRSFGRKLADQAMTLKPGKFIFHDARE